MLSFPPPLQNSEIHSFVGLLKYTLAKRQNQNTRRIKTQSSVSTTESKLKRNIEVARKLYQLSEQHLQKSSFKITQRPNRKSFFEAFKEKIKKKHNFNQSTDNFVRQKQHTSNIYDIDFNTTYFSPYSKNKLKYKIVRRNYEKQDKISKQGLVRPSERYEPKLLNRILHRQNRRQSQQRLFLPQNPSVVNKNINQRNIFDQKRQMQSTKQLIKSALQAKKLKNRFTYSKQYDSVQPWQIQQQTDN